MKLSLAVIVIFGSVLAEDQGSNYVGEYHLYRETWKFIETCGLKHLTVCLKERALKYVESLPNDIDLGGGFRIRSDPDGFQPSTKSEVILPEESRAKEEALDKVIFEKMAEYIGSHTVEFKFPLGHFSTSENEVGEGRKRKGGGGEGGLRMKSMLMLLQLKVVAVGAIILKFIGIIAFKALMMSKIALLISGVIALKKLAESKHHSSTYEVVAHPYDDHHYDRAFDSSTGL